MSNLIYRTLEVLMDLLKDSGRVKEVQAITESHKIESAVQKNKPDVLFLDIKMPGINGKLIFQSSDKKRS